MTSGLMLIIGMAVGGVIASVVFMLINSGNKRAQESGRLEKEQAMSSVSELLADADAIEMTFRSGGLTTNDFRIKLGDKCNAIMHTLRINMHILDVFFVKYAEQAARECVRLIENPERRGTGYTAETPESAVPIVEIRAPEPVIPEVIPEVNIELGAPESTIPEATPEATIELTAPEPIIPEVTIELGVPEPVIPEINIELGAPEPIIPHIEAKAPEYIAPPPIVAAAPIAEANAWLGAPEPTVIPEFNIEIRAPEPIIPHIEARAPEYAAPPPIVVAAPPIAEADAWSERSIEEFEAAFAQFEQEPTPAPVVVPMATAKPLPVVHPPQNVTKTPTDETMLTETSSFDKSLIDKALATPNAPEKPQADNAGITGDDVIDTIDNIFNLK